MRRTRERGAILLALAFVVVAGMALAAASRSYGRLADAHHAALAEEAGALEARGGIREMAARLAAGGAPGPLERTDAEGTLKVAVEEDRIRAVWTAGRREVRASARWRRAAGVELDDWRDE